jgi:hypothetical protein
LLSEEIVQSLQDRLCGREKGDEGKIFQDETYWKIWLSRELKVHLIQPLDL